MRFAHMADCHIGGWRDPRLKDLSVKAFEEAIHKILDLNVDFILIAGDLFHTSIPSFDTLKATVKQLKILKDADIPVYVIPGSHDFSPSGKTMIDVFEEAGLLVNVYKGKVVDSKLKLNFTIDKKTGAKITGLLGKKGMLERAYYDQLDTAHLESEPGFRIFMLHTAITEMKPLDMENMDSMDSGKLPKGFDYYAAGHVHIVEERVHGKGSIVYPGPLFPNNFRELEKLRKGGFYMYEDGDLSYLPVETVKTIPLPIDCSDLTPEQAESEIKERLKDTDVKGAIVMIRLFGALSTGKPTDIAMKDIFRQLYASGAAFVMKNTIKLTTPEFNDIQTEKRSIEEIEESAISALEAKGKINDLMRILSRERMEGEKVDDFTKRIIDDASRILEF